MSVLYIANTTKQHHDFLYRIPGENSFRQQKIIAGEQARIYNDCSIDLINQIVGQHERYGLKSEREVLKTKEMAPYIFSIDRPVNLDSILYSFSHNDTVMDETAVGRREEVVASIAAEMEVQLGEPTNNVTVEIVEETKPGEKPRVNMGVEVTRDPSQARHSKDRRPPGRTKRIAL